MTSVGFASFREIAPEIFSQILEGIPEKSYQLKGGSLTVVGVDQPQPKVSSMGSLNASGISDKVREFLKYVKLNEFYNTTDQLENKMLCSVFKQIINGKESEVHEEGETAVKVTYIVKLLWDRPSSAHKLHVSSFVQLQKEAAQGALKGKIEKLLLIPCISSYFGVKP